MSLTVVLEDREKERLSDGEKKGLWEEKMKYQLYQREIRKVKETIDERWKTEDECTFLIRLWTLDRKEKRENREERKELL